MSSKRLFYNVTYLKLNDLEKNWRHACLARKHRHIFWQRQNHKVIFFLVTARIVKFFIVKSTEKKKYDKQRILDGISRYFTVELKSGSCILLLFILKKDDETIWNSTSEVLCHHRAFDIGKSFNWNQYTTGLKFTIKFINGNIPFITIKINIWRIRNVLLFFFSNFVNLYKT